MGRAIYLVDSLSLLNFSLQKTLNTVLYDLSSLLGTTGESNQWLL